MTNREKEDAVFERVRARIQHPACWRCQIDDGPQRTMCWTCNRLTGCRDHHICFERIDTHVQAAVDMLLRGADFDAVFAELEMAGPPPAWPEGDGTSVTDALTAISKLAPW